MVVMRKESTSGKGARWPMVSNLWKMSIPCMFVHYNRATDGIESGEIRLYDKRSRTAAFQIGRVILTQPFKQGGQFSGQTLSFNDPCIQ